MNYKEAKAELDSIIEDIENGDVDIDALSTKLSEPENSYNFVNKNSKKLKKALTIFLYNLKTRIIKS